MHIKSCNCIGEISKRLILKKIKYCFCLKYKYLQKTKIYDYLVKLKKNQVA